MTEIWKVTPEKLEHIWPHVEGMIDGICQRGYSTADGFRTKFANGESQLWVIGEADVVAIVVTDLQDYPGFRACRITQCTGKDRKRWIHHLEDIKAWALSVGCDRMQAIARPGWASELKDFKKTHLILECDL